MIYAIPHNSNAVANHFIKAEQFAFIDGDNKLIKNIINPGAGNSSCSDKSAAINALKAMNIDAVLVKNIGQRSLGKLLSAGIRVFRVSGRASISEALNCPMEEMTDASQGRPSRNHEKKGGCSHDHGHEHTHGHGIRRAPGSGLHLGQGRGMNHGQGQGGKNRAIRNPLGGISSMQPLDK